MTTAPATPALGQTAARGVIWVAPLHHRTGWTLTMHYWVSALMWSLLVVLAATVLRVVETFVLDLGRGPQRMVKNPFEFATRVVGFSHHAVALAFLLGRLPLRAPSAWVRLAGLAGFGILASTAFGALGGRHNPVALAGFYVLFLLHAFRDEVFFYRQHSGSPSAPGGRVGRELLWLQVAAAGVLGLLIPALAFWVRVVSERRIPGWLSFVPLKVSRREATWLSAMFPADWSAAEIAAVTALPWLVLIVLASVRLAPRRGQPPVWSAHAPLAKVLAASLALAFGSVAVGGGVLYVLILLHFVAWFQFTMIRLGRRPEAGPRLPGRTAPLAWLRRTRSGFVTLHGGLAGLFLGLIAVDDYALAQAPWVWPTTPNPLTLVLGRDAFYYWTIMHVMLSLGPKPGSR